MRYLDPNYLDILQEQSKQRHKKVKVKIVRLKPKKSEEKKRKDQEKALAKRLERSQKRLQEVWELNEKQRLIKERAQKFEQAKIDSKVQFFQHIKNPF